MLIEQDLPLQKLIKECSSKADHLLLLSIPDNRKNFVRNCVNSFKAKSTGSLNDTLTAIFCNCAAGVLENRKVTNERFDELSDTSSLLYNEIAYRCGSPIVKPSAFTPGWKATDSADIIGASPIDSIEVIVITGMHKIKLTIGGITKVWLLDSGASDLLTSDDYAKELKAKGVLTDMNYIGEGLYTLADNSQLSCKRYKIDSVRIGRFLINNVILATSTQAKEFLLGKSLLNKFSQWILDNKSDRLILKK